MTAKKRVKPPEYPPLPTTVCAPAGAVTVELRAGIVVDGAECWGLWHDATRTVSIDPTARPAHQWRVYFHEMAHVALDDSGLSNGMAMELVECICDAMASARMREKYG